MGFRLQRRFSKRKGSVERKLKAFKRGYSFRHVTTVLENEIGGGILCDIPEQFLSIGFLNNKMISIVYEVREDDEGQFTWIITYWKTTKEEIKRYSL